jgi:hypothetical protein
MKHKLFFAGVTGADPPKYSMEYNDTDWSMRNAEDNAS